MPSGSTTSGASTKSSLVRNTLPPPEIRPATRVSCDDTVANATTIKPSAPTSFFIPISPPLLVSAGQNRVIRGMPRLLGSTLQTSQSAEDAALLLRYLAPEGTASPLVRRTSVHRREELGCNASALSRHPVQAPAARSTTLVDA